MQSFDPSEFKNRLAELSSILQSQKVDAVLLNTCADLCYYTGSPLPLYLVAAADGGAFMLARKADSRIARDVPFIPLEYFQGSKELEKIWSKHRLASAKRLGFTCDSTSYATVTRMRRFSPSAEIVDLSQEIRFARMKKSKGELEIMRRAGMVIARMPEIIKSQYKAGMTELELSAHIEHYFRLEGNGVIDSKQEGLVLGAGVTTAGLNSLEGNKFDGICAGKGLSCAFPAGASRDVIPPSVPVLFDYGFVLEGYHIDMTRMGSVGRPQRSVMDAYNAMVDIEDALVAAIRPGDSWESAWELALSMARGYGYEEVFMGSGRDKVRFVGHGVGIQLDEPPFLAPKMERLFEEGMTIALEPKVALPGIGVVGIEDTILVGERANEIITPAPRDFILL